MTNSGSQWTNRSWVPWAVLCAQSYPALCKPMHCSLPGSSVHGIFQARILEWVAITSSRGSPQVGDQIRVSCSVGWFCTTEPSGKPMLHEEGLNIESDEWQADHPHRAPAARRDARRWPTRRQAAGLHEWNACHTSRAPRCGDEGSDSRNSKDTSYLIVPEKPTTGPLASKEPRAHGAGSKLWEPLVPGCLALIFRSYPGETIRPLRNRHLDNSGHRGWRAGGQDHLLAAWRLRLWPAGPLIALSA